MAAPLLVLVGGFLGAGKTTLILAAAKLLQAKGMKVAAIMNDQDEWLVDTQFARASKVETREVAGGCFCCRFSELLEAADELLHYGPDVIFAEPVGSCIDLSATILQPLKMHHHSTYRVAPLTVLIDPDMSASDRDEDTDYLFRNQIAEADIVCSTKADLYSTLGDYDFSLSARTGEGVENWITEVMNGNRVAGAQLLEVDYARYAEAEAALGWVNIHADVELDLPRSPASLVGPLMEEMELALEKVAIRIEHLKVFDQTRSGFLKASITASLPNPQVDGDLLAEPETAHELAINLRAVADPLRLESMVEAAVFALPGQFTIRHRKAFRPTVPQPQYRFSAVV